jgi:hypothetical protein
MVRTQIQLPDEIYTRARSVAAAKEISMAELTRRGLELILDQYPAPGAASAGWTLPLVEGAGFRGLSDDELRVQAQTTRAEEELEVPTSALV